MRTTRSTPGNPSSRRACASPRSYCSSTSRRPRRMSAPRPRTLAEVHDEIQQLLLNRKYDERLKDYYDRLHRSNHIDINPRYRATTSDGAAPSPAAAPAAAEPPAPGKIAQ